MKKYFNLYSLLILGTIAIIITSIIIVFFLGKRSTISGVEIVITNLKEDEEITEEEAISVAVKQFGILGEKVNAEDLKVHRIERNEVEYYYIVSPKNTIQIKILGGKIERINTILIDNT